MPSTVWIRVKDRDTGHEYDVAEQAVDPAAHEVLKNYPTNNTGLPRPAKHRTTERTTKRTTKATTKAAEPTKKEQ